MAFNPTKDPSKIGVQLNVKVPWDYREMLVSEAKERHTSLNAIVREALDDRYGVAYLKLSADQVKQATRGAGATT
jgi:hypothetical protein